MNANITLKDLLSFGSIGATIVGCAFFFGALATRVDVLERSTVTAERIARLEANMDNASKSANELKISIESLARQLRRARTNEGANPNER